MPAIERIVVQATLQDKQALLEKARELGIPRAELMRRGAFAYSPQEDDEQLASLADAAKAAAEKAIASIDDALSYIEASNRRIERLEAEARAKAAGSA